MSRSILGVNEHGPICRVDKKVSPSCSQRIQKKRLNTGEFSGLTRRFLHSHTFVDTESKPQCNAKCRVWGHPGVRLTSVPSSSSELHTVIFRKLHPQKLKVSYLVCVRGKNKKFLQ